MKIFMNIKKAKGCHTQFGKEEFDSLVTKWEWIIADSQTIFSTMYIRERIVIIGSKVLKEYMHEIRITEDLIYDRSHFSIPHFS